MISTSASDSSPSPALQASARSIFDQLDRSDEGVTVQKLEQMIDLLQHLALPCTQMLMPLYQRREMLLKLPWRHGNIDVFEGKLLQNRQCGGAATLGDDS